MPNKFVLIAEDDNLLRDLYQKKFSLLGYQAKTASDGKEALALIEEEAPDVLILDINMPVLDGFGVLEQLPPENRSYPVIILTNLSGEETREKADKYQVDDFLIKKDMTIRSLIERVEALLGD